MLNIWRAPNTDMSDVNGKDKQWTNCIGYLCVENCVLRDFSMTWLAGDVCVLAV